MWGRCWSWQQGGRCSSGSFLQGLCSQAFRHWCQRSYVTGASSKYGWRIKKKKRKKTAQAVEHPLHQFRKGEHIGQKYRMPYPHHWLHLCLQAAIQEQEREAEALAQLDSSQGCLQPSVSNPAGAC